MSDELLAILEASQAFLPEEREDEINAGIESANQY